MRKRLIFPLLFICAIVSLESSAQASEAYMVFTAPGEEAATQMHISWHSSVSGTRMEYTKASDATYTNSITLSEGDISQRADSTTFGGTSFYRCHVLLRGLDQGTDYIFRIGNSTMSTDHRFKTASGRGEFSFIYMSDVHAYPPLQSRVNRAVSLVSRARQREPELDFILFTGDLTAHGANYTHWQELSEGDFISDFMLATSPGNHDYYNSSAVTIDDRYYNAAFKNPGNGAPGALNTTYWFQYNNVLFISLNTEANSAAQLNSQGEWLRQVIENNPAQYVVAYAHRGFFLGSTTTVGGGIVRKSSDSYRWFGQLLEEMEVDLVLAGHNHVYVRTKPVYGGVVAPGNEGTIYITANQIGDRGRMAASGLGEFGLAIYGGASTSDSISTVSIFTISEEAIYGELFDAAGVVHDSFAIPARRDPPPPVDDFDREAYVNLLGVRVNPPDLTQGILGFRSEGYERVESIEVLDRDSGGILANFTPSAGMTEAFFGPIVPGRTYLLTARISFHGGALEAVHLSLVNKLPAGSYSQLRIDDVGDAVLLRWDNHLVATEIERIEVSVDDRWTVDLSAIEDSVDIAAGLVNGINTVEFNVVDRYGDFIFKELLNYQYHTQDVPPVGDVGVPDWPDSGGVDDPGEFDGGSFEDFESRPRPEDALVMDGGSCDCGVMGGRQGGPMPWTLGLLVGFFLWRREEANR